MSNQLALQAVSYEIGGSAIELKPETVKNYLVRGNGNVTDQEVLMFMNLCQYQKLNPMINEAYLIKFGQQPAQIIVSKEAFMKRAEADENFEGFDAGIIYEVDGQMHEVSGAIKPKNATLLGGWCRVYRIDRKKPIEVKVSFDEFSKGQATWKDMPLNMIRKVAIVNALREAFPNTLGAMYAEEEARKNATDTIPEYQPTQCKDITPAQEVIETTQLSEEDLQIKKTRSEINKAFKTLGITTKAAKAEYMAKHTPNIGESPSLADLVGLLRILEMHIEMNDAQQDDADTLD